MRFQMYPTLQLHQDSSYDPAFHSDQLFKLKWWNLFVCTDLSWRTHFWVRWERSRRWDGNGSGLRTRNGSSLGEGTNRTPWSQHRGYVSSCCSAAWQYCLSVRTHHYNTRHTYAATFLMCNWKHAHDNCGVICVHAHTSIVSDRQLHKLVSKDPDNVGELESLSACWRSLRLSIWILLMRRSYHWIQLAASRFTWIHTDCLLNELGGRAEQPRLFPGAFNTMINDLNFLLSWAEYCCNNLPPKLSNTTHKACV